MYEQLTHKKRAVLIAKIHEHKLPCMPGFVSAVIQDGPWEGYRVAEAMALSLLGAGPLQKPQPK